MSNPKVVGRHAEAEPASRHRRKAEAMSEACATRLRRYLSASAEELQTSLAGRHVEIEAPTELEVVDFALEFLTLWAQETPLGSDDNW